MKINLPHNLLVDVLVVYVCEEQEYQVGEVESDLVRVPQVVEHRVDNCVSQFEVRLFY